MVELRGIGRSKSAITATSGIGLAIWLPAEPSDDQLHHTAAETHIFRLP